MPPLGLFIDRRVRNTAQGPHGFAVGAHRGAGNLCAGRLVHKRQELVREAGHCAPDANAAHVGTAADTGHPSAFGYVAINNRPPAAELDDALGRAIARCEVTLLVISGTVATVMNGPAEKPRGPQLFVKGNHGRQPRNLVKKVEHSFHEVVRLHRAPRNIDNGKAGLRFPVPAKIISESHASGWVALHSMDAAIGGAGSAADDGDSLGSETVDPLVGCNWLTRI